jgi:hypothetical protein
MSMSEPQSGSGDRIFKATLIVLLFFFNLLGWGMFVSCRCASLASFASTNNFEPTIGRKNGDFYFNDNVKNEYIYIFL